MKLTCGLVLLLAAAASACAAPSRTAPGGPWTLAPQAGAGASLSPARTAASVKEADTVLAAIWSAAEALPREKQARLVDDVLQLAALAGDADLLSRWERRLGASAAPPAALPDYAGEQARAVIADAGWTGFLDRAARQAPPFHIGRPEIMAAGVRLAPDTATAQRVIAAMFDLARTKSTRGGMGDDFEKGDFGHALAELGMQRCDLSLFDRGRALTPEPEALRYALWRTRITGGASRLTARIAQGDGSDDTRHVRQAIDGYAPVLAQGYCPK